MDDHRFCHRNAHCFLSHHSVAAALCVWDSHLPMDLSLFTYIGDYYRFPDTGISITEKCQGKSGPYIEVQLE